MRRWKDDGEYSVDQNMRNNQGAFAGTKKKTSTVRNVVNGDNIPDLQLQKTSWHTQITRSALARQSGIVGEGQKRVVNAQHGLSMPIDNVAAGGKPFRHASGALGSETEFGWQIALRMMQKWTRGRMCGEQSCMKETDHPKLPHSCSIVNAYSAHV